MSKRDQELVQAVGMPVAKIAVLLGKSRQTVNRGILGASDYLRVLDFTKLLDHFSGEPGMQLLVKNAVEDLYPELSQILDRQFTRRPEFALDVEGADYWLVSGDLVGFQSSNSTCAGQLEALCGFSKAQVKIFVNGYDFEVAKKIESNHQGNWVQAIRCQADLSLFPSMLLRIETSGGLVLFGPSEDGFIRLAHSEALRLRLAIYRLLVEPTEEQASISKPASDAAVAVKALALSA